MTFRFPARYAPEVRAVLADSKERIGKQEMGADAMPPFMIDERAEGYVSVALDESQAVHRKVRKRRVA